MEDGGEVPAKPESKLPPQLQVQNRIWTNRNETDGSYNGNEPGYMYISFQSLIELICNVQAMEDAVKEMKYDIKKAPLGNWKLDHTH